MKKILLALLVISGLGGGGYYYAYQQAAKDYPIKVLESVLSELLKDPESYKRLSSTAIANEDNSEMFVEVEYTAKNPMGGTVRSKALMVLENYALMSFAEYVKNHPEELGQKRLEELRAHPFTGEYVHIKLIEIDGKLIGKTVKDEEGGFPLQPFIEGSRTGWYPFTAPEYEDNRAMQHMRGGEK